MISVYLFGVVIVVLFVAGLVVAPLLEEEPADPGSSRDDASPAERREAALEALEELEFEHETRKLSDEDYRRLRNKYARAAVAARDEEERDGPARCPECGAETDGGARYCARCGSRLPA